MVAIPGRPAAAIPEPELSTTDPTAWPWPSEWSTDQPCSTNDGPVAYGGIVAAKEWGRGRLMQGLHGSQDQYGHGAMWSSGLMRGML